MILKFYGIILKYDFNFYAFIRQVRSLVNLTSQPDGPRQVFTGAELVMIREKGELSQAKESYKVDSKISISN